MEAYSLEQSPEPLSISDAGSSTGTSPENHCAPPSKLNPHHDSPSSHWDQYLDLKTGKIYCMDWGSGRKAKKMGWTSSAAVKPQDVDRSDDEEGDDDMVSVTESEAGSCMTPDDYGNKEYSSTMLVEEDVLVVAGCKQCLMYFMLPKMVDGCPKCRSPLLHLSSL